MKCLLNTRPIGLHNLLKNLFQNEKNMVKTLNRYKIAYKKGGFSFIGGGEGRGRVRGILQIIIFIHTFIDTPVSCQYEISTMPKK